MIIELWSKAVPTDTTPPFFIVIRQWAATFVERVKVINIGNLPLTVFDIALVDEENSRYGCQLGDVDLFLNTPGAPWICGDGIYAKGHLPPLNETRFAKCAHDMKGEELLQKCVVNSTRLTVIDPGAAFPLEITFAPMCSRLAAGVKLRMWTDIGVKEIQVTARLESAEQQHCLKILALWAFEKDIYMMGRILFLPNVLRRLIADQFV